MDTTQGRPKRSGQAGFTLVELLIVVIILGILAAIVVPQFGSSSADAKAGALQANLAQIRHAIELYHRQHNETMPGDNATDGTGNPPVDQAATNLAFLDQLTKYTDKLGGIVTVQDAAHPYGPYLQGTQLPKNEFDDLDAEARLIYVDAAEADLANVNSDVLLNTGWLFFSNLGRFIANDGATLPDGTATETL